MTEPLAVPSQTPGQDRLLRIVVIGTAIATLIVVIVGLLTLWRASSAADSSAVVQQGTDLQGCRSLARAPLDAARTDMERLILDGLSTSASGDRSEFVALLAEAELIVARLEQAQEDLTSALEQSINDPDAFLASCNGGTP
jgi:hypothetical protein